MPESNLVECYLCGNEAPLAEMAVALTPTLGHYADPAMSCKSFCPDSCFPRLSGKTVEHTDWEEAKRREVHNWQDDCATWAKACIREYSDETLREMESLPEGLKVTPSERARCAQLKDKLDRVEDLQSFEDNVLLHKICRNINKNPVFNAKTATLKDYDSAKADFSKLEKLSPEEREKLNG